MDASAPRIKFCAITDPADARLAVEAGAWALGVILWPRSRRRCPLEVAVAVAAEHRRRAEIVGVFVNQTLDEVARAADEIGLTMLQLHGDEGPAFCAEAARRTGCRVIKAARVRSGADIRALAAYHTDFHLLDSHVPGMRGGTGETWSWELAREHRGPPVILSGGLNAGNVAQAIAVVRPFAVDVATGVEDPDRAPRKDPERLRAFAAAVADAGGLGETGARRPLAPGAQRPLAPGAQRLAGRLPEPDAGRVAGRAAGRAGA
ncbi:MAG TPA: phosphoribosylanthranilate isomerase [Solirubrobacteraceae bacterium]|nr:phosphoribosylanthranilate isomerase [Solirubrobacteraceae bacterium]